MPFTSAPAVIVATLLAVAPEPISSGPDADEAGSADATPEPGSATQVVSVDELPPASEGPALSQPPPTPAGKPRRFAGVGRIIGGSVMIAFGAPWTGLGIYASAEFHSAPLIALTVVFAGITAGGIALTVRGAQIRREHLRRTSSAPQLTPMLAIGQHGGHGGFVLRF